MRIAKLLAATVIAVALLHDSASAQDPVESPPQVTVKLDKSSYLAFEPVFFTVRFDNPLADPIYFQSPSADLRGSTFVELSKDGGAFVRMRLADAATNPVYETHELAVGDMESNEARLFLDRDIVIADDIDPLQLGNRDVRLSHPVIPSSDPENTQHVQSNTVSFVIVAPSAQVDKDALALLADANAKAIYLSGGTPGSSPEELAGISKLENIVDQYPASAYAAPVALVLGDIYYNRSKTIEPETVEDREGNQMIVSKFVIDQTALENSRSRFAWLVDNCSNNQILLRARLSLARIHYLKEEKANAESHLDVADTLDVDKVFEAERENLRELIGILP